MYVFLLLILLALAAALLVSGVRKHSRSRIMSGALLAIATILFFFGFLGFWGEMLWYEALGYQQRFWTEIAARGGAAIVGAVAAGLVVFLLTLQIPRAHKSTRFWSRAVGAVIGGWWGVANWEIILRYLNRVSTAVTDPIFGREAGFYLFTLPFYDNLYTLLLLLTVTALAGAFIAIFLRVENNQIKLEASESQTGTQSSTGAFYFSAAAALLVLAWGKYLNLFHLMYSDLGAVTGPGWTDANIRLPAYWIVATLTAIGGILLMLPPFRRRLQRWVAQRPIQPENAPLYSVAAVGTVVAAIWFFALMVIPGLFQWLRVSPNEITLEKPYIANNIQFTRQGFNLHEAEEREYPAAGVFTQAMVDRNRHIFSNVRLWDWRALDAVYKQFQEIRLYYEFVDVDIDRYMLGDAYRQVMVSAREMNLTNLPAQSQTFVNQRFKYTHGYGLTLTNVSEFTPEGLPNLLIKNIPPKGAYPELEVQRPQIYYGELTQSYAIVNTQEEEFDYPSGDQNVYIHYPGAGGVKLTNLWRKFLFGWKFGGTKFFFSSYPTAESRIMFHRQIKERVKAVAPFLDFDEDPYIVLAEGKLYWIIDGYTTSTYYPYSAPFSSMEIIEYRDAERTRAFGTQVASYLHGANYVRNSVKAVVDAFNGSVDLYVFDPADPIVQVWRKIFPELFKDREHMPEELRAHVRYPAGMLLAQGLVYAKYHMSDPEVFYNQEDLWIRATEKYYDQVQPVEPYYVMWELPDSSEPEFSLILPFTPKNRQVLIGWIAGLCDGENYGRFLAYKFPKEKRVLGPQQVETKIDQDSFLAGQLTLWDQRGSNVIRGNVLAIPVEETIIYVEPIYLQAETAAYPELRLVAVMHNDNLSYAETFDEALRGLFEETAPLTSLDRATDGLSGEDLIEEANDAFESYLQGLGEKRYEEAVQALKRLENALQQLEKKSGST